MSFWDLSTGDSAVTTDKEYNAGGGDFEPLPKGTSVLALVADVAWKAVYQRDERFVNVKWQVVKPEGYAGRVIFQKLFVADADPNVAPEKMNKKRDSHKTMLATIDANGRGRLAKVNRLPTDDDLALALKNVTVVLTMDVWEQTRDGNTTSGNWVRSIKPNSAEVSEGPKKAVARKPAAFVDDLDGDDVPF